MENCNNCSVPPHGFVFQLPPPPFPEGGEAFQAAAFKPFFGVQHVLAACSVTQATHFREFFEVRHCHTIFTSATFLFSFRSICFAVP